MTRSRVKGGVSSANFVLITMDYCDPFRVGGLVELVPAVSLSLNRRLIASILSG
jgi:hypothetical protein